VTKERGERKEGLAPRSNAALRSRARLGVEETVLGPRKGLECRGWITAVSKESGTVEEHRVRVNTTTKKEGAQKTPQTPTRFRKGEKRLLQVLRRYRPNLKSIFGEVYNRNEQTLEIFAKGCERSRSFA